jgi:hypothetical protein
MPARTISPQFPGTALALRTKAIPAAMKYLIHNTPAPDHRPIGKISNPAAEHLAHRHILSPFR